MTIKMVKTSALCCLLFSALISQTSLAKSPSFTYLEAEYVASGEFEITDGNLSVAVDMDGFALNASVELGILLLQASRFELESDEIFGANLEDSISTIAIGLTFELPQTAIYGLVRGRRDELSLRGAGFDEDEDGNSAGVEAGVRFNVTDRFELNANIGLPDLEDGTSYGVGAQFYLTKNLGLTLDYSSIEIEDEELSATFDTTSIGIRYNF
ncbi:MAG: hypothetical protein AAF431_02295 [Pseudomonadota bacterium]